MSRSDAADSGTATRPVSEPDVKPLSVRPQTAIQVLDISMSRLYELLAEGKITARKLGTSTLIPYAELERFLRSLPLWEGES